jgi:putative NADH-flavin reductase
MHVTVFGATGRIGRIAVHWAIAASHAVTTVARHGVPEQAGVTNIAADVRDLAAVERAVRGAEALIAALGPRSNTIEDELSLERGMRNILDAAGAAGVTRLILLSGAAVDVPGDRKPAIDRLVSRIVRRAATHVVGAKQREYSLVSASNLEWTALRPPLVVDGPPRGYRLDLRLRPGVRVTRADVGQALVDQLDDRTYLRKAPFLLPVDR